MLTKHPLPSISVLVMLTTLACTHTDSPARSETEDVELEAQAKASDRIRLADPTIIYRDKRYYLYGTERPPQKGFPVLISKDLKHWSVPRQAENGYALRAGEDVFGSRGFWAPQVFQKSNTFYMAYTANENIGIARSEAPWGPFVQSEAKPIDPEQDQIDPFVFRDDDGKHYLYHVRLNRGNHIYVAELEEDFSGIKENTLTHCLTPKPDTWEDTQTFESPVVAEGPTVLKHKGTYYLFYSANHFKSDDYAVGYATAQSPLGPWKRYAGNPILNKDSVGANGTGHGDIFVGANNQLYYVFHVHASDTEVHPRATIIVKLRFRDTVLKEDSVEVDFDSAFYPVIDPT